MQKQTRSNVNEQLRLRTVDCTCPLHRPEFRIQRNSLAKKPKVTGRRDAAIQRCILKGRGKGRPKRVGHSADPPQPSRFYVQLDGNDDMYMLVIPREFKQCLKGILPRPIKLKTSVGCAWYVHIDEYQGELVLKDGWFGFAEAHELQLDDLLVFEVKDTSLMNVLIYDRAVSPFPRRHGIEKKERKGLSFREAEMWDPWASSVLLVSKAAGDKKKANSQ
ncbi:hypothetical protein QYE76_041743 [Lolium multiflorum]|nr:hypothetical protein QYE76_041743 [Lolium multiflorum]